ncbi:PREDICTED: protein TNT [Chinchilla lanigera]|uniref:protein TNT n=1 Tax=Chinchilla lanigera TaxID=34839 RepID=UPI000696DB25|nr:PREDICTED: protein TNT [Chinchilla lanigera]
MAASLPPQQQQQTLESFPSWADAASCNLEQPTELLSGKTHTRLCRSSGCGETGAERMDSFALSWEEAERAHLTSAVRQALGFSALRLHTSQTYHHGNRASQSEHSVLRGQPYKWHPLSLETPQSPEASQGCLLLDKPIPLPPLSPKAEEGGSSACDPQGTEPSPCSPSSDIQPPRQASYAAALRESLRAYSSPLAKTRSKQSLVHSMLYPRRKDQSSASLVSSGYAGDEENSSVSIVRSQRIPRLTRKLNTRVGSAWSSQLSTVYSPRPLKSSLRRQSQGQGPGTKQTGGEA